VLGRFYFQNVASSSIFASQKSFYSEAYHVMDEWSKCPGRRNEAGFFMRGTETDERINTVNESTELPGKASTKHIGWKLQTLLV
jgi:hypothetical protein